VLGRDASPLAVRIARTKTWLPGRARLRAMEDAAARMAAETLEHVRLRRRFPGPRPRDADWFPAHVVHELAWLRAGVAAVQDAEMREVLELCLSSILVKVSRRASDTDERVRERKVTPGAASRLLAARAAELAERLRALAADVAVGGDGGRAPVAAPPTPQLTVGDARNLAGIEDLSVDAILTSPPYPNTYDYLDLQRLRLRWLELDAGLLAETEIGARRLFKTPNAGLKRWDRDGERWVAEVARVLKPGGWCVVLMGDGMVGATVIRADESLVSWARRAGLAVVAVAAQERPQLEFRMRRAYGKGSRLEILAALRRG
ncbi:MAG TPA: hypothetical protein VG389_11460, partial [Myxococcota bacterium]|nr:hypothetical protein [Myxococcota bacterium]